MPVNGALDAACGVSRQKPNNPNPNPNRSASLDHIRMSYVLLLSPSEDLTLRVSGRGLGVTRTRLPMSPSAAAAQQLWISWSAWGLWRKALRPASAWGWGEPWRVCGRGDARAGAAIAPMHVCTRREIAWKAMATHSFTDTRAVYRPSFLPARINPFTLAHAARTLLQTFPHAGHARCAQSPGQDVNARRRGLGCGSGRCSRPGGSGSGGR